MISLDNINRSIKADILPIDKEVNYVVHYAKYSPGSFLESSEIGSITGSGNILLGPPNDNENLTIKEIILYNNSDAEVSINLYINETILLGTVTVTNGIDGVDGTNGTSITVETLSQLDYDNLVEKDPNILYLIQS